MKIGTQVALAFGAVLGIIALVETVALGDLASASRGFDEYRRLSHAANVTSRVRANMLLARLNAKEYILSRDANAVTGFAERFGILEDMLAEAIVAAGDDDDGHLEALRLIESSVDDYRAHFEELSALLVEQDRIVATTLEPEGLAMREELTAIIESAYADGDQRTAYLAGRVEEELLLARLHVVKFLVGGREEDVERAVEEMGAVMEPHIASLDAELRDPDRRALFEQFVRARIAYLDATGRIRDLVRRRERIVETRLDVIGPLVAERAETVKLEIQSSQRAFETRQLAEAERRRTLFLLIAAFGIVGAAGLAVGLVRAVKRPLGGEPAEMERVARRIASGDLAVEMRASDGPNGGPGGIYGALAGMRDKLREIVGDVGNTTAILETSGGIAAANARLGRRTEEQAAGVTQTIACMERMTCSVRENAGKVEEANALAGRTREAAEAGGSVVRDAIGAMREISASGERIADIVGVVNEIAFQTNLLALNAAVEAARAGESGRGFAVVATEVRALARKSADAAGEIRALIEESVRAVDKGSALVDSSGATFETIVTSVQHVSDIVGALEQSSREQGVSIDEVNLAMEAMDRLTRENADIVDEVTRAGVSLEREVGRVSRSIGYFSLEPGRDVPETPVARRPSSAAT